MWVSRFFSVAGQAVVQQILDRIDDSAAVEVQIGFSAMAAACGTPQQSQDVMENAVRDLEISLKALIWPDFSM